MTAHYPKLRIPTASVTDTLLETVISLRRWRGMGGRCGTPSSRQQTPGGRSQPHRPGPQLPLNRRGLLQGEAGEAQSWHWAQSLTVPWTQAASPPSPPQPGARAQPTGTSMSEDKVGISLLRWYLARLFGKLCLLIKILTKYLSQAFCLCHFLHPKMSNDRMAQCRCLWP